jgi:hypothetical protein
MRHLGPRAPRSKRRTSAVLFALLKQKRPRPARLIWGAFDSPNSLIGTTPGPRIPENVSGNNIPDGTLLEPNHHHHRFVWIDASMYPGIEDARDDHDTFEQPLTGVRLVLLSAALLETIDPSFLRAFTNYGCRPGMIYKARLWDHVEIAAGTLWVPTANTTVLDRQLPVVLE